MVIRHHCQMWHISMFLIGYFVGQCVLNEVLKQTVIKTPAKEGKHDTATR